MVDGSGPIMMTRLCVECLRLTARGIQRTVIYDSLRASPLTVDLLYLQTCRQGVYMEN